jgi:3-oxoacyl-[acyl-carrier protein] reductase
MPSSITLDLTGRTALITGGSRGIGAAAVRLFVQAGANVVFNYQRAKDSADALVNECGTDKCHAVQAELDCAESAKNLVAAAVARFGRVDILIGNHGIWPPHDAPIDQMTEEQWRRTISINLDSVYGLVKHSVAQMKKQAPHTPAQRQGTATESRAVRGHIVLISSTAGQRGEAFHADYAATKGAVISMVKGLSTELAPDGIYVNCVAPGWVSTDMAAPALADAPTRTRIFNTIPLHRVGRPEEVAASVLFLCTSHAGFITGEIMNVNGGAVLVG